MKVDVIEGHTLFGWSQKIQTWYDEFTSRLDEECRVKTARHIIHVVISTRMTRKAGEHSSYENYERIKLSSWMNADEARITFGHEVAHLVDKIVFGSKEWHGPNWKSIMELFKLDADKYHNYPLKERRKLFTSKSIQITSAAHTQRVASKRKRHAHKQK